MRPGGLINLRIASAMVVLPEPDSPAIPSRSPAPRLKLTASVAFTAPSGVS